MQPNSVIQFELIEHGAAENMFIQQHEDLQTLKENIQLQLNQIYRDH
jgi:hypothetical protein